MAHNLTRRSNGFVEFAFTGSRSNIWHGLGNEIAEGASRDEWERLSGLGYEIKQAPVLFSVGDQQHQVKDRWVFYRSDNQYPLGVASDNYKVVQPREILDFLFDLCATFGYKMTTAGTLLGGKRYWAQLAIGMEDRIVGNDLVAGHLGFCSSADGSMASTIKNGTTRWVCNNTINIGLGEAGHVFRFDHRVRFDEKAARKHLGLAEDSFVAFIRQARELSKVEVNGLAAEKFVLQLLGAPVVVDSKEAADEEKTVRDSRGFNTILDLFNGAGKGSTLPGVRGTQWGLLNAVTEYADWHVRSRSDGHRLDSAQNGPGAKLKEAALAQSLDLLNA